MKIRRIIAISVVLLSTAVLPVWADNNGPILETGDAVSPAGAPSAVIPQGEYEFEAVLEGVEVVHEFIVENTGTAPLEINQIKTGCGCTTADFTRVIPPAGKGGITIRANTKGYGGKFFRRQITVYTNDPKNKTMGLIVTGSVERFADITPSTAMLNGKSDEHVETQITIRPNADHPFKVVGDHMDQTLTGKIEYSLLTLENGYLLMIRNSLHSEGRYFGRIFLKTDNPDTPEIAIPVSGKIG